MPGSVFLETLCQNWRTFLIWGVGFGFFGWLVVLMIPDVEGLEALEDFFLAMPPFVRAMVGVFGDTDLSLVATPEGFIAIGFFNKMVLIFAALPLVLGFRVTTHEEDEGILDMVLSLPLARWRIIIEKFAAFALGCLLIVAFILVGFWAGAAMSSVELNMGHIVDNVVNLFPTLLFVLSVTVAIGAIIRRRKFAIAAGILFVVYSFSLDLIGGLASGTVAENLRYLSFFHYYDSVGTMQNGIAWSSFIIFIVLSLAVTGIATIIFQRRDVAA